MTRVKLASSAADAALAKRIADDLRGPFTVVEGAGSGEYDLLVLLLSKTAEADPAVRDAMIAALDVGKHVVPVLAEPVALPRLINHLTAADFSAGAYPIDDLRAAIAWLTGPDAPLPMRVLTPKTRRKNRGIGLIVFGAAFIMFAIGIIAVGVFDLEAPAEEYANIETQIVATRDALIGPTLEVYGQLLPRSTDEAAVFEATLERIPTVHRPFRDASATAAAVRARPTVPDVLPFTPTPAPLS